MRSDRSKGSDQSQRSRCSTEALRCRHPPEAVFAGTASTPGGNRQLNFALHTIALTRLRMHRETQIYIARKSAEGKSHKEVMRCLKRQLSNVIYRQLLIDVKEVAIAA